MVSISLTSNEARNRAQRIAPSKYSAGIDLHGRSFVNYLIHVIILWRSFVGRHFFALHLT